MNEINEFICYVLALNSNITVGEAGRMFNIMRGAIHGN